MSTAETIIPGKDAPLDVTIARMQAQLAARGFNVVERSWLNPVEGVWSVHVSDADCPLLFTNGKGASEMAARASALGEFFERLSCHYFWSHYYLGESVAEQAAVHYPQEAWFPLPDDGSWPEEILTPELQAFYNPEASIPAERLVDLNSGHAERGICALPYTRLSDSETVYFPVNIIGNLYVSNGMAAGNTQPEARAQALSEIIERFVKFRVLREGLCLPDVPVDVIARYPKIAAGIAALRAAGFGILVKDASLGGVYPVMNVTLLNPKDQGCFVSFGAHPSFEVALERALTELLQGRALDALDGFPELGFDLEEVAEAPNLEIHFVDSSGIVHWNFLSAEPDFDFVDWDWCGSTEDDYQALCDCIADEGAEIYAADFTHQGVYACRILVPGMSEIYPVDDLEWENSSVGNAIRAALIDLPNLDEDGCEALFDTLDELDLDDQRPVAALIGLAPDADSAWKDLRIGELKTLLSLALSDDEGTRAGCEWIRHFGQLDADRLKLYRCIEALIGLDGMGTHPTALVALYGEDTLALAERLLDGEERFFGLNTLGANFEGSRMHTKLLAAYAKAQAGVI